jgi:hypothetical protein
LSDHLTTQIIENFSAISMTLAIALYDPVLKTDSPLYLRAQQLNNREIMFKCFGVVHAKEMGDELHYLKAEVKKQGFGSWTSWLEINCPAISPRTARLYMQISKCWDDFLSEMATGCQNKSFTVRDAQEAMNARNRKQKPLEETDFVAENAYNRKQKPLEDPDFVSEFKRSLRKADKSIDLFLQNDLDAIPPEASQTLNEMVAELEHRLASVRQELRDRQEAKSDRMRLANIGDRLQLPAATGASFGGSVI